MANWVRDTLNLPEHANKPVVKRARNALHLRRPDGLIEALFTGLPCHFVNESDQWEAIDTDLRDVGAGVLSGRGTPARIDTDGSVKVGNYSQKPARIVRYRPSTAGVTQMANIPSNGTASGDTYVRSGSGWTYTVRITEVGARHELVLSAVPSLPGGTQATDYICIEEAVSGLSLPDGDITLDYEIEGMKFPAPTATDANGDVPETKRFAKTVGGVQYIYTGVPTGWLQSAAYPVVVDPDFAADLGDGRIRSPSIGDRWPDVRATASSWGIASSIETVGAIGGTFGSWDWVIWRLFFNFDTSSIPDTAIVTQANLKFTAVEDLSTTDCDIYILKNDWSTRDPIDADNMEANFDSVLTAAKDDSIWRNTSGISINTQYTSGDLSTAWINKTGYTYYSLASSHDYDDSEPASQDGLRMAMQNHGTADYRPVLTVVYTPSPLLVAWPSTVASIPSGWGRRADLDGQYLKGAADATDPGDMGGAATHGHTSPTHDHVWSHTHTTPNTAGSTGTAANDSGSTFSADGHTHVSNPATVNPTATDTEAIGLGTGSNDPAYHTVIWLTKASVTGLPDGAVAMYAGGSAPTGWSFCDGAGGTPDLRNKFLKGAAEGQDGGSTGGGAHDHTSAHTHGGTYAHGHPDVTSSTTATGANGNTATGPGRAVATQDHTHAIGIDSASPAVSEASPTVSEETYEPAWKKLAYVKNTSGSDSAPDGIIAWWSGLLSAIPEGWNLCDGTNDTPDLREKFVKGANTFGEVGNTGGAAGHGHTSSGTHTHDVASHQHSVTVNAWTGTQSSTGGSTTIAATDHAHTANSTGAASLTSGAQSITVDDATDSQPPFYTVAFIQKAGAGGPPTVSGSATGSGVGSSAGDSDLAIYAASQASGAGSSEGAAMLLISGAAQASGQGTGLASGEALTPVAVVEGSAAGSGAGLAAASATLTVVSQATGSGFGLGAGSGQIAIPASGVGQGLGAAEATANLLTAASAAGAGLGNGDGSGLLQVTETAAGIGNGDGTGQGLLAVLGQVSASGIGAASAEALLTVLASGLGGGVGLGTATGDIAIIGVVEGAADGSGIGLGQADGTINIAASAQGQGAGLGATVPYLVVLGTASGEGQGNSLASGLLAALVQAAGSGSGTGITAAQLAILASALGEGIGLGLASGEIVVLGVVTASASGAGLGSGLADAILSVFGQGAASGQGEGSASGLFDIAGLASGAGLGLGDTAPYVIVPVAGAGQGAGEGAAATYILIVAVAHGEGAGVAAASTTSDGIGQAAGSGSGRGTASGVLVVSGSTQASGIGLATSGGDVIAGGVISAAASASGIGSGNAAGIVSVGATAQGHGAGIGAVDVDGLDDVTVPPAQPPVVINIRGTPPSIPLPLIQIVLPPPAIVSGHSSGSGSGSGQAAGDVLPPRKSKALGWLQHLVRALLRQQQPQAAKEQEVVLAKIDVIAQAEEVAQVAWDETEELWLLGLGELGYKAEELVELGFPEGTREERERFEKKIERAAAKVLKAQQQAMIERLRALPVPLSAAKALDDADDPFWEEVSEAWTEALEPLIRDTAQFGARAAAQALEGIAFSVDMAKVNQPVLAWSRQYTFDLVKGLNDTTRATLGQALVDWQEGKLGDQGLPDLVKALEPTFGGSRAQVIGATEATRAFAAGNQQSWLASGVVTEEIWKTAVDERVCPYCFQLNETVTSIKEEFVATVGTGERKTVLKAEYPPLHVNCRCSLAARIVRSEPVAPSAPVDPFAGVTVGDDAKLVYGELPDGLRQAAADAGLKEVRIVNKAEMSKMAGRGTYGDIAATYTDDGKLLILKGSADDMGITLYHEVGHVLDPLGENGKYVVSESPNWLKASGWKQSKAGKWTLKTTIENQPVSKYGATAPWEDFAETFRSYMTGSDFDRRVMQGESEGRYQFMKKFAEDKLGISR